MEIEGIPLELFELYYLFHRRRVSGIFADCDLEGNEGGTRKTAER